MLKRPGGNLKERSPVGNGCMGGRLGAKKSGAVAIQNWNCSITSYSDHAPHPSSPLAIFGHQSFLDICTHCRERGRIEGWDCRKFGKVKIFHRIPHPPLPPPSAEADDVPSNGFALTSSVRKLADDGTDRPGFCFRKILRILPL